MNPILFSGQQAAAMLGHFAWPNLTNPEDVKQFFLFQIEVGDVYLTLKNKFELCGNLDKGLNSSFYHR